MNHGLAPRHLDQIRQLLQDNCPNIDWVGLFGSRATGNYKETSDIDLVIYGDVSTQECDRLYTVFLESLIPYKVDITSYNHIAPPLKKHIDTTVQPLFTREQMSAE